MIYKEGQKIYIKKNAEEIIKKINLIGGERFQLHSLKLECIDKIKIVRKVFNDYVEIEHGYAFPFESIEPFDLQKQQMLEIEESL